MPELQIPAFVFWALLQGPHDHVKTGELRSLTLPTPRQRAPEVQGGP